MATLREKNRLRKQAWRTENPGLLYSDERPFVGVDGEGGTTVTGSHDYFLLRVGEQAISNTERALTSEECLEFLAGLDPNPLYVAYFFDYDTTKICQDLPWGKLWRLIHREERLYRGKDGRLGSPFPVDVLDRFQIDYLPRKFVKVRRNLGNEEHPIWGPWIEINDVGTFFQCPFVDALERWDVGTPEQRAAIRKGKEHRRTFDARDLPDIDKYNHLECRLLVELMDKFRATCKRAGYVPRKWQGPGQIAEAMMRARGIPKTRKIKMLNDPENAGLLAAANASFYGGRPEITRIGPVFQEVYQWDINSAYPFALLHVPCLEHGEWRHYGPEDIGTCREWRAGVSLVRGHFQGKPGTRARLFGYPVRRENGSIYYPREGNGWYWSQEIRAASHQVFTPREAYVYRKRCECQPFRFIHDLYEMRLRLGKDALGLFLKLALNSLYGKSAQSIGSPQYANPIWASFITSFTRAMVAELFHLLPAHRAGQCGRDVLMVATDAIFTTSKLPVEPSKAIGGLDLKVHQDGLLLVQPGLYFTGDGSRAKTRGVPVSALQGREEEFMAAWESMFTSEDENAGVIEVPVNTFIGIRQALHRRKLELMGTWIEYRDDGSEYGKKIGFEWKTKRTGLIPPTFGGAAETFPYAGSPSLETVPYSREIGAWRDALRLPFEDQPDWGTVLMPPDTE